MLPPTPNPDEVKGEWVEVRVVDAPSVCVEESLMVCALRTMCVALHPSPNFGFYSKIEEVNGKPRRVWRWILAARSADGTYETNQLRKWWNDPAWLAANPTHEFAMVCKVLRNMGVHAAEVRAKVPRNVIRRGKLAAHIPVTASPALRAHRLGQVEGKIPLNAPVPGREEVRASQAR